MNEKILNFLRDKEGYTSGQDIAESLNLSRQGLWKHIQELRKLGYDIVAVPHLGYKLLKIPDRLYPWEIKENIQTDFLGKKAFYFDSLSSTMDKAWALGQAGQPEGILVCSEKQTQGKGRLGRSWISKKYKGLYFSLLLRPNLLPCKISCITLLSAVAVLKAIKKEINIPLSIKWPNDILLEGKKIAGILTEVNAEQDRTHFVIVGIGININHSQKDLIPEGISIFSYSGKKIDRITILKNILKEFELLYSDFKVNGPQKIKQEWKKFSYIWGSKVRVSGVSGTIEGEALDLDADGALLVRNNLGIIEKIIAGDIAQTE